METLHHVYKEQNTTRSADVPAQRIAQAFARGRQEGRGLLMPYLMCGYPSAPQSVELIVAAAEGGADLIELGMPFSDPLADGATVQHAGHVALQRGMTIKGCMEIAHQVSTRTGVPLLLMGYYNPVMAYGIARFCADARKNGVSGLIIPDLPPEEATPLHEAAQREGLAMVFLIPPTTPDERIARIAELSASSIGSFIYCVSLSGTTGARATLPPHLRSFIERVRRYTDPKHIPLAIGFGVSTREHVAEILSIAEGAVVGSAVVNTIDRHPEEEQVEAIRHYIKQLR